MQGRGEDGGSNSPPPFNKKEGEKEEGGGGGGGGVASRKGEEEDIDLPDLSGIDFSEPDACKSLKEEHEECFFDWMKRFTRGEVKKDECQIPWRRYQHCVAVSNFL